LGSRGQAGRGVTTAIVFLIITFLMMEEPSKVEDVTEPRVVFEARTTCSFDWWLRAGAGLFSERKVLLAGCWWLVWSERKVLLAGGG
jgi:hypothetical protein